ncbi:MAG: ThiF family adenylyltransferase [Candidatus Pacebacteria bacterium]|nr:ThiF family adenylyltransferase [Candidatus Paceibacterota bacterium]
MANKLGKRKKKAAVALTENIRRDVAVIERHPHVISDSVRVGNLINDWLLQVSFKFRVLEHQPENIPNENGVNGVETVFVYFPKNYPAQEPSVYLRADFPSNLPHINPYRSPRGEVSPCFFEGKVSDLLAQPDGIMGVINQVHQWLRDAALGELIDLIKQGWEPQRRDQLSGTLIADQSYLEGLISDEAGHKLLAAKILIDELAPEDFSFMARVLDSDIPDNYEQIFGRVKDLKISALSSQYSVALCVWPNVNHISSDYAPNSVSDFRSLCELSQSLGCEKLLSSPLTELLNIYRDNYGDNHLDILIIIIARRPANLIGKDNNIEILPYNVSVNLSKSPVGDFYYVSEESIVEPVGHRHAISKSLLGRISHVPKDLQTQQIHLLGCGSVGSKIAMHFGRAGLGKFALYDNGKLSPHNSARHASLDDGQLPGVYKTHAVAYLLEGLACSATPINANIVSLFSSENTEDQKNLNANTIIDTTASLQVWDAISSAEWLTNPLFQTGLFGQGRLGFVARENAERTTKVCDIQAMISDLRISHDKLRAHLPKSNMSELVQVGQGCSSATMVMADDALSEHTAGMSKILRHEIRLTAGSHASLWLGYSDHDKPGVDWEQFQFGPFISVPPSHADGWEIRISETAATRIEEISRKFGEDEYGGVIFGAISTLHRRMIVTRVIDAPSDSEYSKGAFILGTSGLKEEIKRLFRLSGNTLTYLGTWHSHPKGGGPSSVDRSSAQKVSELRLGAPSALLIWTPQGYRAAVEPKT